MPRAAVLAILIFTLPAIPLRGQTLDEINQQSAKLEADLKKTLESSSNGARALLALIDHYYQHGRVFGLVRNARKFVAAQSGHPRHKEVMVNLVNGLYITSRHDDLITAARQFLGNYGDTPEAAQKNSHSLFWIYKSRERCGVCRRSGRSRPRGRDDRATPLHDQPDPSHGRV